jgi:hypothetical protein
MVVGIIRLDAATLFPFFLGMSERFSIWLSLNIRTKEKKVNRAVEFQMGAFNVAQGGTLANPKLIQYEDDQRAKMAKLQAERAAAEAAGDGWLYGGDATGAGFETDYPNGVPIKDTQAWLGAEAVIASMGGLLGNVADREL